MPNTIDNKNLFLDTQFQQFVQFAETAIASGKQKAIARVETSEVGDKCFDYLDMERQ